MEYITATKKPGEKKCFLCIEEGQDEESLIIGRLGKAFVIMNRFPYTNGHVMVVPLRHTGLAEDLTDEESLDMMRLVRIMVTVYKEEFKVVGVNIVSTWVVPPARGLEEHILIHLVPRGSEIQFHGCHRVTR